MNKEILKIIKVLKENISDNSEVYIVGGFLRDLLIGVKTTDIDISVKNSAESISKRFSERISGTLVKLGKKNDRTIIYRVVKDNFNIDFTDFKGKDIVEDLYSRDFTINAMALNILKIFNRNIRENLIDPYGGEKDIKKGVIKHINKNCFIYDPLRILRAYRFNADFGFKISPETEMLMKKSVKLINKVAYERIRDEIFKILENHNSFQIIKEMDRLNLLTSIIPEISTMKKSPLKFYFHKGGLWEHSLKTLKWLDLFLSNPERYFGSYSKRVLKHLEERISLLKLTALLHDAGKPLTARLIENRIRFFEHEEKGAKILEKIFERMKMSVKEKQIAVSLVKNHMRPGNLAYIKNPTKRAIYRFFRDMKEISVDLLILSIADRYSYLGVKRNNKKEIYKYNDFIKFMLKNYFEMIDTKPPMKLVDGYDVMKKFSLKPGPLIGKILKYVDENYAIGKIKTKEEAFEKIKKRFSKYLC